jgi:hypothetical protein
LLNVRQAVEILDEGQGSVAHGLKVKGRSMELHYSPFSGVGFGTPKSEFPLKW